MGEAADGTVPGRGGAIIRGNPGPARDPTGSYAHPTVSSDASRLVGRERELRALAHALDRLAGGQAAFAEVTGEPGIGKTRLLGELAADAERRGHLVLRGRATEFERDAPY